MNLEWLLGQSRDLGVWPIGHRRVGLSVGFDEIAVAFHAAGCQLHFCGLLRGGIRREEVVVAGVDDQLFLALDQFRWEWLQPVGQHVDEIELDALARRDRRR